MRSQIESGEKADDITHVARVIVVKYGIGCLQWVERPQTKPDCKVGFFF